MRIAIAADHNGIELKATLAEWLSTAGHEVDDRGGHDGEMVDYPPLCVDVCRQIQGGHAERGIVIGGMGGGEVIACNKMRGIRAGLGHSTLLAEVSRANNDTNVLVLGAKVVDRVAAVRITQTWLVTAFKGGQHQRRLDQIAALERGEFLTST